jgi:predicted transposase/invertase (TIGR01784 family)
MQVAEFDYFHKRILYYTSQGYVSQLDEGVEYKKLKPVYFIGILEFKIGQNKNYYSRHKVIDVETKEQIIQDIEFNFIELPKFNKTMEQLETSIDQWTYFIKNAKNLNVIPDVVTDEGLKEAYSEANQQNWTKRELDDYLRVKLKENDEIGRIELAEKKGKIKGKIEGKREEKLEVIKKGKKMGLSNADLSKLTGLSDKEIENL